MQIWRQAKRIVDSKDVRVARELGFYCCDKCGEWFHQSLEGWQDCVSCGRYCPSCAERTEWEWCSTCGLIYCRQCYGQDEPFVCQVCLIEHWD